MSIMKPRKKHRVVKVIGMAVCVVVVLTAGLFFRLMTDTQIIVGAIQNLSQGIVNTKNLYEPLRDPVQATKDNGQFIITEIRYAEEYPNSFLDITYPDENLETDRPTFIYFHGGGFFGGSKCDGDPLAEGDATALLDEYQTDNGVWRIGYVGAHLIASRIYLYMEEWDKVIEHATAALEGAPELCYLPEYAYSNSYYPQNSTNPVVSSTFPETIFVFGSMPGDLGFMGTPINLSDDLVNCFTDENDSRRGMYFDETSGSLVYPYYTYKHGTAERGYVWRTAELYLNRAEAYMEKYKAGESEYGQLAVDDLNELRSNRFTNYTDYELSTAEELEEMCRLERRKELFMEGHRWFDLRRYGMPSIEHTWVDENGNRTTYTLEEQDPGYVVPLSQDVLDRNPRLEQNELAPDRTGH